MQYEVDWVIDEDRKLTVTFDPATEELWIDQYGSGWEGFKHWPDEGGTSVRVSIDCHPTGDDEKEHTTPISCRQKLPPEQ